MVRLSFASLASLPLLGLLLCPSQSAQAADQWWRDPERGCGKIEDFKRTFRIADLPGCDGELLRSAPEGEVAMHDAKKLLREAEKVLDGGQSDGVESKLNQAIELMNKAPRDARVDWARQHYKSAVEVLQARMAMLAKLPKLRQTYKALIDLNAQTKPDAKAVQAAGDACVAAFKEAETSGGNLQLQYELVPGSKMRPLREYVTECEQAKGSAAPAAATDTAAKPAATDAKDAKTDKPAAAPAGNDGGVPRAKWEKKMKGDRKKIFEAHPDAFPTFEGEPGPKGAVKATEWKYGSEVFKFKGNKQLKE
mgnify:CR=1 FL=1|jgi:hypothetical protein